MKKQFSKSDAQEKISSFFKKDSFSSEDVRKIKRLAMKYNIKLSENRKKFCKKCLSKLKGKIRITKNSKSVNCSVCGYKNQWKL